MYPVSKMRRLSNHHSSSSSNSLCKSRVQLSQERYQARSIHSKFLHL